MFDEQVLQDILSAAVYKKMPLDQITPAPYNPRVDLTPEDQEYQDIRQSIINHGMLQPIIYNERTGNAVGGNQRLKILTDMGVKEATCAVVNLTLLQEMEANIALNRLGNMWEQTKLREVMLLLKESGYDTARTAFSESEIDKITQDLNNSVASFFEEPDEDGDGKKEQKTKSYKCPYCGEVFSK